MLEKFQFTPRQVEKYYDSALKDLKIAKSSQPEIVFVFCYNCLIKMALAVCAKNNLRVKARRGHHIALIAKLAEFLQDKEIEIMAEEMRAKRNKDLYGGGVLISQKEAMMYFDFLKDLSGKIDKYLDFKKLF
jgi:hypothetical protein